MAKIIAVTNQKGGVGKTTTAVNLSASLAAIGQRILLVDLDPQGSTTVSCGIDKEMLSKSINDLLLDDLSCQEVIHRTEWGFDLLPANGNLSVAELRLVTIEGSDVRLKQAFKSIDQNYDYILIDCPPALNILAINALTAAESVIVPLQCEYFALEGLSSLMNNIERIRRLSNPNLYIQGLLRTMYDGRNRLTMDVSQELLTHFKDKVYQTIIPRNVRLAEAPSHGMPVLAYDKQSQGAAAYLALAAEMLRRDNLLQQKPDPSLITEASCRQESLA